MRRSFVRFFATVSLGIVVTNATTLCPNARAQEPAPAPAPAPAPTARAEDPPPSPDTLFDEGTALLDQGRYADALAKLEEAQRRDPGVGTQFNIAVCHEQLGKLATALREFEDVADQARATGKRDREHAARARIEKLAPRVPALILRVTEDSSFVVVDGAVVDRSRWSLLYVDAGEHTIDVSAPMKKSWSSIANVREEGERVTVIVPRLELVKGETRVVTVTNETTDVRRTLGFAFGGVGLAGAIAGVVTGVILLNAKSTADEHCSPCNGPNGSFDQEGSDAVNRGRTLLPINTIAWSVAAVGVSAGAFFFLWSYLSPPKAQQQRRRQQLAF